MRFDDEIRVRELIAEHAFHLRSSLDEAFKLALVLMLVATMLHAARLNRRIVALEAARPELTQEQPTIDTSQAWDEKRPSHDAMGASTEPRKATK